MAPTLDASQDQMEICVSAIEKLCVTIRLALSRGDAQQAALCLRDITVIAYTLRTFLREEEKRGD